MNNGAYNQLNQFMNFNGINNNNNNMIYNNMNYNYNMNNINNINNSQRYNNNYNLNNINMRNYNINKQMMNKPNLGNNYNKPKILVYFFEKGISKPIIIIESYPDEKVGDLIQKFRKLTNIINPNLLFEFNSKELNEDLTLAQHGIGNNSIITISEYKRIDECYIVPNDQTTPSQIIPRGDNIIYEINNKDAHKTSINIKYIKLNKNIAYNYIINQELTGILKLCFLKEVSQKLTKDKLIKLPNLIQYIMEILSRGYIPDNPNNLKQNVKDILENIKGNNIINFSNYIDEVIDSNQIKQILNLLNLNDLKELNDTKYRLSQYIECAKLFSKEFEKAKKESIFEFSAISLVVIERENLEIFERERCNCPNREEQILYHGTSVEPISSILTGLYRKSIEEKNAIIGKGVYFTNLLDYAWYYGGKDRRANFNGFPKIGDTFTVIVNHVYYDKNGLKRVSDGRRTPGKNQVNMAYSGAASEILKIPDKTKFLATEYVINDLNQICPFMSIRLKRVEYCVIWRDNNFSSKPVFNNEYDQIFKEFLKERKKYINQLAKYNIYPCETTEEALELVKRKKYNKIILISNVGSDYGGRLFIDQARNILGYDIIALFLAYNVSHIKWIKTYKNALFSNEPKFYEDYLRCFEEGEKENVIKAKIESLISKMENHYNVKFNFDKNFLYYRYFKEEGNYNELRF
mgnify:CR=1 FL=1